MRRAALLVALALAPAARAQNLAGDEALSKALIDGEGWRAVSKGLRVCAAVCADAGGQVYFSDPEKRTIHRLGPDGKSAAWWTGGPAVTAMTVGSDGRLYAVTRTPKRQVIAVTPATKAIEVLVEETAAEDLAITAGGALYFTEPDKGQLQVLVNGTSRVVASNLAGPRGVVLSGDGATLAASEHAGTHVWTFRVEPDGALSFATPWMDLRTPVGRVDSGGMGMAVDFAGRWYIASRVGIQMFDAGGRMGGVIADPPGRNAVSLAFAGEFLYACAGDQLYRRKMKTSGAR